MPPIEPGEQRQFRQALAAWPWSRWSRSQRGGSARSAPGRSARPLWRGYYTVDRTRWAPLGEDDCD
jgi:hypothetical protein